MEPVVLDLGTGIDVDVSLALLETLFSSGPVGYAFLDRSLRFVRVSERLAQINGLPAEAHLGRTVEEVLGADRWPSRRPILERALAGETILDIALSSLPNFQSTPARQILASYYPVRSSQQIVGLVAAVRDMTDQVAAQARLRQQSAAFENMWDALLITDLAGRITECNEAFVRHSGYSREETLGQPISFLHMPKERDWVMPKIAEGLRRDGRWEGEVRFLRKDGSQGVSLTSVVPLRDEEGNIIGTVGVSRDITERKTAEQDLRARAEREALLGRIGQAAFLSPNPEALQTTALSFLGERLKADRCFYVLYDEDRNIARIEKDWCREGIPSLEGEWDLTERGMRIMDIYSGGQTEVVEDVAARPLSPRLVKLFLETGQRSYVAAPFFDQGRPVAALTVMMASTARAWSKEEVAFVESAAVQVRGAVETVRAAQREREAQVRQRAFLRDVLASVTEGHLILCDPSDDLPSPLAPVGNPIALSREGGLWGLRRLTLEAAEGMVEERRHDLVTAVSEAGMNVITHGGGQGTGRVSIGKDGTVQVRVEDQGAGIALESLPKATLARGFSTQASLGHGFKMMQQVDRVCLLTGPTGTTVVMEQGREESPPKWLGELHI